MTDYALLDKLFQTDQARTQFNRDERTPKWVVDSQDPLPFSKQLAFHHDDINGHTSVELEKLADSVLLPVTISVTALVRAPTLQQLQPQLQALLAQTIVPTLIWVACKADEKEQVQQVVSASKDNRIKLLVRDEAWMSLSLHAPTEFVWILDKGVVPGRRYLQRLLKLSHTEEYRHALLGTEAVGVIQNRTVCVRYDRSRSVDVIEHTWLLRRTWLSGVLGAVESSQLSLSRALRDYAGVPSIYLPTEDPGALGETRYENPQSCKVVQENETIDKNTVAFIANGIEDVETLAPLFCRFSRNMTVHVFITYGPLQAMSDFLQHNYSRCDSVRLHNIDIHNQNDSNDNDGASWRLPNEVIRGLTREIAVIRPRLMIHLRQRVSSIVDGINIAGKITKTVTIGLPARDIPHVLWMADLPLEALERK
ncbi:hypothetical protein EC973_001482 [Apophysomyces ossiformis]|uniref:Uncharacterized protein n=1 Tax=Apophysomyces ossiformis TaxID=679940 RepID=A0A8H7BPZ1_9FUNG|nr:hypothetical protein EC973_001482 [Apophysomyces ossiformis]